MFADTGSEAIKGLMVMLYGLTGVFAVLTLLYIITKLLVRLFAAKQPDKTDI